MQKCQYIHESDLPPLATADEIAHIRGACDQRTTTELGFSAKKSISAWQIQEVQLRSAIIRHINAGKRLFHKYKDDRSGKLLPKHVQANVTLSSGLDIYVEAVLMQDAMII
ncbi:MAG: hypothetical protein NT154_26415, partial [Verrucomicrobia bacterium]|nr:hypothetical protein [Verrucomicrobiota bacterium]